MKWDPLQVKKFLLSHEVFSHFETYFINLLSGCEVQTLEKSEFLLTDNQINENYFVLILEGSIEVIGKTDDEPILLNTLYEGGIIGKTPKFRKSRSYESFRAKTITTILLIPAHHLDTLSTKNSLAAYRLFEKLQSQTFSLLENINQKALDLVQEKKNIGFFIVNLTVMLALFAASVTYFKSFVQKRDLIYATTPLLFVATVVLVTRLIATNTPLSTIGLNTKNLKATIKYALVLSAISCFVIVLIKFTSVHLHFPWLSKIPTGSFTELHSISFLLIYPVNAIFEDLLIRGGIQGLFVQFLEFRYRHLLAIILSSLVFAGTHAAQGLVVVLSLFFPSLFWGWMYYKQGNIIGVIITHVIIGFTYLGLIGVF